MTFKTVFDASHHGVDWDSAFGLIFVFVGLLLVFRRDLMQCLMPLGLKGPSRTIFSWLFLMFAMLWTAVSFSVTLLQYRMIDSDLSNGRYLVVEGRVTDFIPMPYTGHSEESFKVQGHRFSYSDYTVTSGFHTTASHGGPIREGLQVRVAYSGDLILRLEIAQ